MQAHRVGARKPDPASSFHARDAPAALPSPEAREAARRTASGPAIRLRIAASRRIAGIGVLGGEVGALGGVADGLRALSLTGASGPVIAELAIGCAVVGVLTGIALAVGLGVVWELTEHAEQRLLRTWPFLPRRLARNLPLGALLLVVFAEDGSSLFLGPGISRTAIGAEARWVFPWVACLFTVVLLRVAPTIHARLRRVTRPERLGLLVACVAVAALLVRAERLPQLDEYSALRRYSAMGAFLSTFFGLALFGENTFASPLPPPLTRAQQIGYAAMPLALCLSLPFLFPSNAARLALASRSFVASPEVHALRRLVDFDRDGYSPLVGGGDGNDFDRRIHPFARSGDGVDRNRDGVDESQEDPSQVGSPYGPTEAPAVADLRTRARGKNVLVVLVDAMRFDRLQGERAGAFPRLAGLLRQSVSFTRAFSPASRTRLALPAIFDGSRVPGPGRRLFHEFHAAGSKAGFASLDVIFEQLQLAKRFGKEVDLVGTSTAGDKSLWGGGVHIFTGHAITESALRWVDDQTRARLVDHAPPWLLWAHYFGAHQWDQIESIASVPGISERYDTALADDDRSVGELLDGLAARGLSSSTVVALVADHGESLGDHGWRTHGTYLHSELVHVPFSILVPGVAPRSISTPVPTEALAPTLFDLSGIARPDANSLASLAPLMAGVRPPDEGAPRAIVMHDTLQDAIVLGRRFLRITPSENVTELFSLDDMDTPHPEDLVAREPAVAHRLTRLLVNHLPP